MNAALVPCPDCGQQISRRASSCPQCGAPAAVAVPPPAATPAALQDTKPGIGWIIGLVVILGIVWALTSGTPDSAPGSSTPSTVPAWDKSEASQQARLDALTAGVQAGVVSSTACGGAGPAQLRTRPAFNEIPLDLKTALTTALLEYCFEAGDEYGYVEARDDRNGLKIGHLIQGGTYRAD